MNTTSWKPTACILCECNCGIEVQVEDRHLVKLRGDKAHPGSRGYACEKAHRLDYYQHSEDRVTTPLRRCADGSFEAIDWDTAIAEVSERLARVRDTFGGDKIFYYGGGGQGNHLPGAYATATRRALGSRWRSSALAQEKTGEFWIGDRMLGAQTRADFEHCDVGLFLGKNPWHSHSIARARVTLKEIAKDPERCLIVIDPRRTETAAMADIHLAVRPGSDAWLLSAIAAVIAQEDLVDRAFLDERTDGWDEVVPVLLKVPVAEYAARSGVEEQEVRRAARVIAGAKRLSSFEDLGVQMNRHSTLVSYLHRLIWLSTGNLGRPGTHYIPTGLIQFASGASGRTSPVAGARIISGLVPCNVIAEEILTEHDGRYRAMIVEAANPAHSLADSKAMREALRALDTVVVIDVAMSETAREADYLLPASTQYEKAEATFFNFEFPENYFHLRAPLFGPPDVEGGEGPLPEAEIHARLVEALGGLTEEDLAPLHEAAAAGLEAYAGALMQHVLGDARLRHLAPVILYRTLGPTLPDGLAEGAVLLGLAFQAAMTHPASLARAGFTGAPPQVAIALFEKMLASPSGLIFAVDEWSEVAGRVKKPGKRAQLALDDMLAELRSIADEPDESDPRFPFVLSAGERRSFTANTIIRDPEWRKKDAAGALRISPADASELGVESGDSVRLQTARGAVVVPVEVNDTMQAGHVSLPNGLGLGYPAEGGDAQTGAAPNELTDAAARDRFVGTPWHKSVPARLERV